MNDTHLKTTPVSNINRTALDTLLKNPAPAWSGVMQQAHDTLYSNVTLSIKRAQLERMQGVITAVQKVVALPGWKAAVENEACVAIVPANTGVFFGYDFHLNDDGAHLIEINTNAGGAYFNMLLQQSQQGELQAGKSLASDNLEQVFVEMFQHEWQLQRGKDPLRTIVIVDETPRTQYFYPEFVLARQLFERAGYHAYIADPGELQQQEDGLYIGTNKVDLVYNRLTDFSLKQYPQLLAAYAKNQLVLTPHPYAYCLYADKRNLTLLTAPDFLHAIALDESSIAILQTGVPKTRLVEEKDAEQWWKERKEWFFKPATGYGGKGSYRGDKLTQRVFGEIVQGGYVAQRKAMPGEVMISMPDAAATAYKYDVRCYVYEGQVQLVVARLYQGQTTNFRTPGGGFALVRVEE